MENGLGSGNEVAGALWVLLVSWAALQAGGLPRGLNFLGVMIGVSGLLTFVPALELLGVVFGLGFLGDSRLALKMHYLFIIDGTLKRASD